MSDAPERIYLDGDVEAGDGMFPRCFESPKYASEPQVEYIRADLATPAPAVKVKALVWEEPCAANNHIYMARAPWGTYGIHIDGGRHRAWLEAHEKPYERWLGDADVGSVYDAQAVAEADNEKRTRELIYASAPAPAVDPMSGPRVLALVEALRAIARESMGEDGCYYTNRLNIRRARAALSALEENK